MNKATIEQVRDTLEACRVKHQEFGQVPAKNQREIDDWRFHMERIEAALAALSSADSEPTDDRIKFGVITWDGVKYPQILFQGQPMFWGDDPYEEDHSSYMREFIEFLQARLSPPSTHSDVSQDGGNGEARPLWEDLVEIGQEAAAKGAFGQPEAPASQLQEYLTRSELGPVDANRLEMLAKERPDECFLKGSGVLKLTGAIRQLEAQVRTLANPQASPDAQAIRDQALEALEVAFGHIDSGAHCNDHALVERAIGLLKSQAPQPAQEKCLSCGGNDASAPCAYPSQSMPGCLRDARLAHPSQVKDMPTSLTSSEGEVRQAEADDSQDAEWLARAEAARAGGFVDESSEPAAEADERELPPLPPHRHSLNSGSFSPLYTADQMRAYAKAAIAQPPARLEQITAEEAEEARILKLMIDNHQYGLRGFGDGSLSRGRDLTDKEERTIKRALDYMVNAAQPQQGATK